MFNIDNKSEYFFMFSVEKQEYSYIGKKDEFIDFLARGYRHGWKWNPYSMDLVPEEYNIYFKENNYIFVDGYGIKVDISQYKDEVYQKSLDRQRKKYSWKSEEYYNIYRYDPVAGIHKGWRGGSYCRNRKTARIRRQYAIPEYKEFNRGSTKGLPRWWDDNYREVQRCWKEQRKTRHQWKEK